MGERVEIVSTYKPYPNKAKGSLLSAVNDCGDPAAFDADYWSRLHDSIGILGVVVGGDLNAEEGIVDEKISGLDLTRIPFGDNEYTFRSEIGDEHRGRVIDHILTKNYDCSAHISQNGRFLSDHIPIIAKVAISAKIREECRRIGNVTIPSMRPGDEGAKRRLKKEMDKIIAAGLDNWTHDQLVVWTANKAKEIAKSRNRKDNPDGWSPLTRLMRLKVKVLGMAYRRIEAKKGFGDCYKIYKEVKRNMRDIDLSDEEVIWLDDNGVSPALPDWHDWTKQLRRAELVVEIKHLNKLTSSKMRKELRIRHDDWMRKIQEAADKGKIGRMIKRIVGGKP
jgi:hypothetical protein